MNKDIREQILQAAIDELRVHGPNFHMDDLARRLRISKRTLYEHFSSKQEMIIEALYSLMDEVYTRHMKLLQNQELTAEEKLIEYFNVNASGKVFSMRKAKEIFTKMPEICATMQTYSKRDWQILEQIFEQAQENDEFIDFDKTLLIHMLHSAADDVLDYVEQTDQDYSFPEYMEKCIRIILYGIKKDRGLTLHDKEG